MDISFKLLEIKIGSIGKLYDRNVLAELAEGGIWVRYSYFYDEYHRRYSLLIASTDHQIQEAKSMIKSIKKVKKDDEELAPKKWENNKMKLDR